jgi:hypothetical protein
MCSEEDVILIGIAVTLMPEKKIKRSRWVKNLPR